MDARASPSPGLGLTAPASRDDNDWDDALAASSFNNLKGERVDGAIYASRERVQADFL